MSLLTILKTVGKDLSHVGTWIEDGLKVVDPVITTIDPPLGTILAGIETVLSDLPTAGTLTAAQLQMIVTDIATLVAKLSPPVTPAAATA